MIVRREREGFVSIIDLSRIKRQIGSVSAQWDEYGLKEKDESDDISLFYLTSLSRVAASESRVRINPL